MNVDMEDNRARLPRYFTLEMLMSVMVALSGLVLIWNLVSPVVSVLALFIAGMVFTLSITVLIRLLMDPDSVRARQSSNVLQLASQTLEAMGEEGLDGKSAQRICSLLLPSTAAIAIAITCSGSVNAFVAAMNQRAADLGCTNTHFSNPHGYHENDHYTSARDLSLISREAMKYKTFRKIVSTPTYIMKATNVHSKREITSRVDMINPSSKYYVQECIGIKTGFTRKAGQCFVGAARRNGRVVITVALFSTIDYEGRKWFDTNCMFQYCFTRYDQYTIADLFEMSGEGLK